MKKDLTAKVLRRNTSPARIAGFILSNFMGLAIVAAACQFYADAGSIWTSGDSFVKSDLLVVNKKVGAGAMLDPEQSEISPGELSDLGRQPWVRSIDVFKTARFRVDGALSQGGRGFSSALFFEAIPDRYVDAGGSAWRFSPGDTQIPVIIPKDYLTLYNFGFASSAGMPRISEQLVEGIPMTMQLRGDDGRQLSMPARIVGFTNRLNTILVPEAFMQWANETLAPDAAPSSPTRVIIDTNSPGDAAIAAYLDHHGFELAGDASRGSAAYLLKIVSGIIAAVGIAITTMSFFILMLSISLLMEKNRDKIHSLLMLGTPLSKVGAPYRHIIQGGTLAAGLMAIGAVALLRNYYAAPLSSLGAEPAGIWPAVGVTALLCMLTAGINLAAVGRRIRSAH